MLSIPPATACKANSSDCRRRAARNRRPTYDTGGALLELRSGELDGLETARADFIDSSAIGIYIHASANSCLTGRGLSGTTKVEQ